MLRQKTNVLNNAAIKRKDILAKIEEISASNSARIKDMEQYLNLESSGSGLKPKETGETQKKLSENEIYTSAKHEFDQGNFVPAREGFKTIITKYPKSKNADNAQFWIGETYYREKWYEKAIVEYQKVIEKYPKGNKVPASLLKQGLSFLNLGQKSNARLILNELTTKYSKSNESKIAKQKLKVLK
jgi:tol-pal system protein YbgF